MKRKGLFLIAVFFFIVSCSQSSDREILDANQNFTGTPAEKVFTASGEWDILGLSKEEIASLKSLQQLDDYPLYSMDYYGTYALSGVAAPVSFSAHLQAQKTESWACSLFAALADTDNSLFGRNFDWEYSPAILLFTDPPDGYASVSMVDIAYLGYGGSRGQNLLDLPPEELLGLLDAPYLPFDGMNEYGLVVGMAAVPESAQPEQPGQRTIDSLMVIRLVLDTARNVDEALDIFKQYTLEWGRGPALHYLLADRSGRSFLLEFWQGELVVIENDGEWQAATNFLQSANNEEISGICPRFDTIRERMNQTGGKISPQEAMQILESVSQANTQWSVVYGMSDGSIRIVMGRAYEQITTEWLMQADEN